MPARVWFDHFGEITGQPRPGETEGPQQLTDNGSGTSVPFQVIRDPDQFPDRLPGTQEDILDASSQAYYLSNFIPNIDTEDAELADVLGLFEGQKRATTVHTVQIDGDLTVADADLLIDLDQRNLGSVMILLFSPDGRFSRLLLPDLNPILGNPKLQGATSGLHNVVLDDEAQHLLPLDPETGGRYQSIPLSDSSFEIERIEGSGAGTYSLVVINANTDPSAIEGNRLLRFEIGILDADPSTGFSIDEPGDTTSGPVPPLIQTGSSYFSESATANGPGDTDIFSFKADTTNLYTIRIGGANATGIAGLNALILNQTGTSLEPINSEEFRQGADPIYQLEAGVSYFAQANFPNQGSDEDNFNAFPADYSITVRPSESVSDGPISLGQNREIMINSTSQFRTVSFTMPTGVSGRVGIELHGKTDGVRDPELFVYKNDEEGITKLLSWNDDRAFDLSDNLRNRDAKVVVDLQGGDEIFIQCHSLDGIGATSLAVSLENNSATDSIGETLADSASIELGMPSDTTLDSSTDSDWFRFIPPEDGVYVITMAPSPGTSIAPQLVVFNAFGGLEAFSPEASSAGSAVTFRLAARSGVTYLITAQSDHSFAPPIANATYSIMVEPVTRALPAPVPEMRVDPALSIALSDPALLRVVLVTMVAGAPDETIATLPEQALPTPRTDTPGIPVASARTDNRPLMGEQEILQGAALDIIASGAIDQLAVFSNQAGKEPEFMPSVWRAIASAADAVASLRPPTMGASIPEVTLLPMRNPPDDPVGVRDWLGMMNLATTEMPSGSPCASMSPSWCDTALAAIISAGLLSCVWHPRHGTRGENSKNGSPPRPVRRVSLKP